MWTLLLSTTATFLWNIAADADIYTTETPLWASATDHTPALSKDDTDLTKQGYGLPCTRDADCFSSRGLACIELRCNCSPLTPVHVEDKGMDTCLRAKAIYEACLHNEECTKGSQNLLCLDYLCYCPVPYVLKDNAQCVPPPPPIIRAVVAIVPTASFVFIICVLGGSYAYKNFRRLFGAAGDIENRGEEGNDGTEQRRYQWASRPLPGRGPDDSAAIKLEHTNLSAIHNRYAQPTRSNQGRENVSESKAWPSKHPPRFIRTSLEQRAKAAALLRTPWGGSSSEDLSEITLKTRIKTNESKKEEAQTIPQRLTQRLLSPTFLSTMGSSEEVMVKVETQQKKQGGLSFLKERRREHKKSEGSEEINWQDTPSGQEDDGCFVDECPKPFLVGGKVAASPKAAGGGLKAPGRLDNTVPRPATPRTPKPLRPPGKAQGNLQGPRANLFERTRRNADIGRARFELQLPKSLKPANPFVKLNATTPSQDKDGLAFLNPFWDNDEMLAESESIALSFLSSASSYEILPKPDIQSSLFRANLNDPDAVPRFSAAIRGTDSFDGRKSGVSVRSPAGRINEDNPPDSSKLHANKEPPSEASRKRGQAKIQFIGALCSLQPESPGPTRGPKHDVIDSTGPYELANFTINPSTQTSDDLKAKSREVRRKSSPSQDISLGNIAPKHKISTRKVKKSDTSVDVPKEGASKSRETKKLGASTAQDVYSVMVAPGPDMGRKPSGKLKRLQKQGSPIASVRTKAASKAISYLPAESVTFLQGGNKAQQTKSGALRRRTTPTVARRKGSSSEERDYVEAMTRIKVAMMGNEHYRRERSRFQHQSIMAGSNENRPSTPVGVALDEARYILQYDVNLQPRKHRDSKTGDTSEGVDNEISEWRHSPRPGRTESDVFVTRKTTGICNVPPCFIESIVSREGVQITPLSLKDIIALRYPGLAAICPGKRKSPRRHVTLSTVNEVSTSVTNPVTLDSTTFSVDQDVFQHGSKDGETEDGWKPKPKPRLTPPHTPVSTQQSEDGMPILSTRTTRNRSSSEPTPVPLKRNVIFKQPVSEPHNIIAENVHELRLSSKISFASALAVQLPLAPKDPNVSIGDSPSWKTGGEHEDIKRFSTAGDSIDGSLFRTEPVPCSVVTDIERTELPGVPVESTQRYEPSQDLDELNKIQSLRGFLTTESDSSSEFQKGRRTSPVRPDRSWSEPQRLPRSVFLARKQFSEPLRGHLPIIPEAAHETISLSSSDLSASSDDSSADKLTRESTDFTQSTEPYPVSGDSSADPKRAPRRQRPPVPVPRLKGASCDAPHPLPSSPKDRVCKIGVRVLDHPLYYEEPPKKAKVPKKDSVPTIQKKQGPKKDESRTTSSNVRALRRLFEGRTSSRHVLRRRISSRVVARAVRARANDRAVAATDVREDSATGSSQSPQTSTAAASLVGRRIRAFQRLLDKGRPKLGNNRMPAPSPRTLSAMSSAPSYNTAVERAEARNWTNYYSKGDSTTAASLESFPEHNEPQKRREKIQAEVIAQMCLAGSQRKLKRKARASRCRDAPKAMPRLLSHRGTGWEQPQSSTSFSVQDTSAVDSLFAITSAETGWRLKSFRSFDATRSSCSNLPVSQVNSQTNSSESEWYSCSSTASGDI